VDYIDTANYEAENTDDPEWRKIYEERCKKEGFTAAIIISVKTSLFWQHFAIATEATPPHPIIITLLIFISPFSCYCFLDNCEPPPTLLSIWIFMSFSIIHVIIYLIYFSTGLPRPLTYLLNILGA